MCHPPGKSTYAPILSIVVPPKGYSFTNTPRKWSNAPTSTPEIQRACAVRKLMRDNTRQDIAIMENASGKSSMAASLSKGLDRMLLDPKVFISSQVCLSSHGPT